MLDYTILNCGYTHCDKNWISDGNTTGYHKIYYCSSGSAIYQDLVETAILTPGSISVLPQNTPYQVKHTQENHFHVLWFHADTQFPVSNCLYSTVLSPSCFSGTMLPALERAVIERQELTADLLRIFILSLKIPCPRPHQHRLPVLQCVSYIHEHLQETITNDELAAIAGYNKQYFIQIFKKQLGLTPRQYIIHTKFNFARKCLSAGYSIKECAHYIGYENESSFSRDFRALFSMSPSHYQKLAATP